MTNGAYCAYRNQDGLYNTPDNIVVSCDELSVVPIFMSIVSKRMALMFLQCLTVLRMLSVDRFLWFGMY
jgi:hypothetical protein